MDRRKALKNMGMALGYTVATPTLLSIMQSCQQEKEMTWTPDFLTEDQGKVLTTMVDIILPKSDTPSASEVQVHLFIDRFAHEVMTKEEQDFFRMTMDRFLEQAVAQSQKESIADLDAADLEAVLSQALGYSKEEEIAMYDTITSYQAATSEGKAVTMDDKIARFAFANNLRGMVIWAYKTSEYIGENVLAYLPVPGEYIPCGDVQQLTEGKAWSIG